MQHSLIPKRKLGILDPLEVSDDAPYEFYHLVRGVMLVSADLGLEAFSVADVERVFAKASRVTDALMARGIDLIMQSGVPLPILVGLDAHDQLVEQLARQTGKPTTTSMLGVIRACRHMGITNVALANKWRPDMNKTLADFFARDGIRVAGVASEIMGPERFQKMGIAPSLNLAHELARQALRQFPDADGLYIGGGAWMTTPLIADLEREFGKPVVTNRNALIWDTLHLVDYWTPIPGYGRLLEGD